MLSFWEVMDRLLNTGEIMDMDKFDMKTFEVTDSLVKKYGIEYKKDCPIPDSETVEKIFQAGIEAYVALGTYCVNSRRVARFSQDEVEAALKDCRETPPYLTIGCGNEERVLKKRMPFDKNKPLCIGGVVESNPVEGRDFVQLYKSIAQERSVDGFYYGPSPDSCEGRHWTIGTPFEVQAARNAIGWVREALRSVGRPGLHLIDASPSAMGTSSIMMEGADKQGLRQTDAVAISTASELKVDYEMLNKVSLTIQYGCMRNPYWCTIIGGFAGGPEGAAVLSVAHALNALIVYRTAGAGYAVVSTIMQNPPIATTRKALWARNAAIHALSKNTNLICGAGGLTDAGPGTEQQLWEIAAVAIAASTGGGHIIQGIRKAKLVVPTQGSGMEAKWEGEVAKAMAGVSWDDANRIMNYVLSQYEQTIQDRKSPPGFSFNELYDIDKVVPKSHYLELYSKVKEQLKENGVKELA